MFLSGYSRSLSGSYVVPKQISMMPCNRDSDIKMITSVVELKF